MDQELRPLVIDDASEEGIDLKDVWKALKRRQKLLRITTATIVAVSGVASIYQRIFNPLYQGSFTMLISDPIGSGNSADMAQSFSAVNFLSADTKKVTPDLFEFLLSDLTLESVANEVNLGIGELRDILTIKAGGATGDASGVLKVGILYKNLNKGKVILEEVAETYLKAALNQKQKRFQSGIKFLNKQEPIIESKTKRIQDELALFRVENSTIIGLDDSKNYLTDVRKQAAKILALETEKDSLNLAYKAVKDGDVNPIDVRSLIGEKQVNVVFGPNDNGFFKELVKLDKEISESRILYKPTSKTLKSLIKRREELLPDLKKSQLKAMKSALKNNQIQLVSARALERKFQEKFKSQPDIIKKYSNLERELVVAQQVYAEFLRTREMYQLEMAQRAVPWTIISPPSMGLKPVKPSIPINLLKATFFGIIIGSLGALLRDKFDHVFHTSNEVENDLGMPIIAHMPYTDQFKSIREDKKIIFHDIELSSQSNGADDQSYQRFFYQEALRNLYTSLEFLKAEDKIKMISITSSVPKEGKSLINILLAKTLSEVGERVLLIDGDLRKPQIHLRLGLNNITGLSNIVTDKNLSWEEAIQNIEGYPTWSAITSGTKTPDPVRLFSSNRMSQIMKDIKTSNKYDLVIIDTPPILGLADASLVSKNVDGLILLVSLNNVDRDLPRESIKKILSNNNAPLLGIVTNSRAANKRYSSSSNESKDNSTIYSYYISDDVEERSKSNGDAQGFLRELFSRLLNWLDN